MPELRPRLNLVSEAPDGSGAGLGGYLWVVLSRHSDPVGKFPIMAGAMEESFASEARAIFGARYRLYCGWPHVDVYKTVALSMADTRKPEDIPADEDADLIAAIERYNNSES
jgi:hypothetical protein